MWRSYEYYPSAKPRQVRGGIKAQSTSGAFAQRWWAKRWIAVLESFDIGKRLSRGRTYARNGQVISIDIHEGMVTAKVQGTRPTPYKVTMRVKTLEHTEWQDLIAALSSQVIFAAKLLAGEMPQDIEEVFTSVGLSLFPSKRNDLQTSCTCPDWANPCKHVAAVYYLLGEEFDRDPFLIFTLRGMNREELVRKLNPTSEIIQTAPVEIVAAPAIADPLPTSPTDFWNGGPLTPEMLGEVVVPSSAAMLLRRLGNFPFWRGEELPQQVLPALYTHASRHGMRVFLGEDEVPPPPTKARGRRRIF